MKKKIISIFTALVLVISPVSPVLAASNSKTQFEKAVALTSLAIAKEDKITIDNSVTNVVLEEILKGAYETGISMKINELIVPDEEQSLLDSLKKLNIDLYTALSSNGKDSLNSLDMKIPSLLLGTNSDLKIKINLYVSENYVAINVPSVNKNYYYFNPSTLLTEWNSSPLAEYYTLTEYDVMSINQMVSSLNTQVNIDYDKLLGLTDKVDDKYTDFTKAFFAERAFYKHEGTASIENSTGLIATNVYSASLSDSLANEYIGKLAAMIRADKDLYEFLNVVYGNTTELLEMDLSAEVIETIATALETIKFSGNFQYRIYVASNGLIYRNEFVLPLEVPSGDLVYDEETDDYTYVEATETSEFRVTYDTKGSTYLSDEIEFTFLTNGSGFGFNMVGKNVPVNKVTDSNYSAFLITENVKDMDLLNGKIYLDESKKEDNFIFTFNMSEEILPLNFSMTGDINASKADKTLEMTFDSINFEVPDYMTLDMSMGIKYGAIDDSEIAKPENAIKVTKMTEEELTLLLDEFQKVFGNL